MLKLFVVFVFLILMSSFAFAGSWFYDDPTQIPNTPSTFIGVSVKITNAEIR